MSALLPSQDRMRLVHLLGMLGSDHDGERANAGRLADRMVRTAGLTWDQIIAIEPAARADRPKRGAPGTWMEAAEEILRAALITEWERDFCENILAQRFGEPLTPKQDAVVVRIWNKYRRQNGGSFE